MRKGNPGLRGFSRLCPAPGIPALAVYVYTHKGNPDTGSPNDGHPAVCTYSMYTTYFDNK